jgi:hypothetical protein
VAATQAGRAQRWGGLNGWLSATPRDSRDFAAEGLTVFAPVWAFASIFSIAGSPEIPLLDAGVLPGIVAWLCVGAATLVIMRPRSTALLAVLASLMIVRYAIGMPVNSNNQTISFFMNAATIAILGQAWLTGQRGEGLRETAYDRMRVAGRGLLAVMYFYGIFHKINTDFLDPQVSCAVALYTPIMTPFGLRSNIYGSYLAIAATFVVETITLVALYWRRWFAIGLFCGLVFHYVIPISAYSWYMDFSSLVLALYVLSIPPAVGKSAYCGYMSMPYASRERFGWFGAGLPFVAALGFAVAVALAASNFYPTETWKHGYRSVWILLWAIYGGSAMLLLVRASLEHLPYHETDRRRQPLWVYAFPAVLFLSALSPYLGLKTESSIAMFSNLHTEGGTSNHLLFPRPPYLFDYQSEVVEVVDAKDKHLVHDVRGEHIVMFELKEHLRRDPTRWAVYRRPDGQLVRVTSASFDSSEHANWFERTFLSFKRVDYDRPKVCTH